MGVRDSLDIKRTLLRVTTDLYVARDMHSPDEEQQFTELALRLIDGVDADTVRLVAAKLNAYPGTPAAVIERLAAKGSGQPLKTPAPPPAASAPDTDAGPGRPDPSSPGIAPPEAPAAGPRSSPARTRIAAQELNALFFSAAPEERRMILGALEHASFAPAAPLAPAAAGEAAGALERAALLHNAEAFVRELERVLAVPASLARRIVADESGEPILVVAIALSMPEAALQRVLLCLNPAIAQSVQRVYDLATLHGEIAPEAARRMIAIWQALPRPGAVRPAAPAEPQRAAPPTRQPVAETARAAPPARPQIRWDEHASRRIDG